jgi:hypothetical protein
VINKTIKLTAQVLDGEILEHPITIGISCDNIKPIGMQTIRNFWKVTGCIVALDVFLVYVNGKVFGLKDFDHESFMAFYYANCRCCEGPQFCMLLINGCEATVNGCGLIYS